MVGHLSDGFVVLWLPSKEMETMTRVHISHIAHTQKKYIKPTILPPATSK